MFNGIVVLVSGAWLIFGALILNTKNFGSALFFKVVPFSLGSLCLYVGAKLLGLL